MIPLFLAAKRGDVQRVVQLLAQLSEIADPDLSGKTALHLAADSGHDDVVEALIDDDRMPLDAKDDGGLTALHLAIVNGHNKIVERLLAKNPQLALAEAYKRGASCLHLAAVAGYLPIAKQLLIAQPSLITSLDSCRRPALNYAVEYDHKEIVALLMEHARASDDESKSLKVLFFSAVRAGHDDIVRQFLEQSPHLIDEADPDGKSALQLAARRNHQTIVTQLLALKPHSTEVGGDYGMSLLHFAAQYGYDAIAARLLVEHPNLIDVIGCDGKNVLHLAAENGHEQIVDRLLAARPSLISQIDHIERIALHGAVIRGHKTVVEKLLAHSPSTVDAVDCDGRSVLYLALLFGQTEIVPCLLAHKSVKVDDKMLWYALHSGREPFDQVVKSLLTYNPKLIGSVDDSSGNTVLHRVFGFRESRGRSRSLFNEELMQAVWDTSSSLLEAPHKMNRDKETPFHVAVQINNEFAIELMQWSLSLDEIVSAFDKCYKKCPQSLLDQLREYLLMSLDKDVVGLVYEYLGFGEPKPQPNKRGRDQKKKTAPNKKPAKKKMVVDKNSDDHASEDDEDEHDQGELDEGDGSEDIEDEEML